MKIFDYRNPNCTITSYPSQFESTLLLQHLRRAEKSDESCELHGQRCRFEVEGMCSGTPLAYVFHVRSLVVGLPTARLTEQLPLRRGQVESWRLRSFLLHGPIASKEGVRMHTSQTSSIMAHHRTTYGRRLLYFAMSGLLPCHNQLPGGLLNAALACSGKHIAW